MNIYFGPVEAFLIICLFGWPVTSLVLAGAIAFGYRFRKTLWGKALAVVCSGTLLLLWSTVSGVGDAIDREIRSMRGAKLAERARNNDPLLLNECVLRCNFPIDDLAAAKRLAAWYLGLKSTTGRDKYLAFQGFERLTWESAASCKETLCVNALTNALAITNSAEFWRYNPSDAEHEIFKYRNLENSIKGVVQKVILASQPPYSKANGAAFDCHRELWSAQYGNYYKTDLKDDLLCIDVMGIWEMR